MESQATTAQEAPRPRSGPGRIGTLVVIAVTGAIILAVAFIANQPAATTSGDGAVTAVTLSGTAAGAAPVVGKVAPDFSAPLADGSPFRLSDLKGQPVWLTFGASWCQPCRAENPDIQAAYDRFKADGIQVVQVYMAEDANAVNDYAKRVGITYTKVPDPNERLASDYRILGIPTHYFIDADGIVRQMKIGSLDPAAIETAIKGISG
jgi:peroxiredoxin